jgi:hypothetical protein
MFAHDLCHSQVEYFRNAIDFNRKDRAKRYHKSSIFNLQSSIPACPGWVEIKATVDAKPENAVEQPRRVPGSSCHCDSFDSEHSDLVDPALCRSHVSDLVLA